MIIPDKGEAVNLTLPCHTEHVDVQRFHKSYELESVYSFAFIIMQPNKDAVNHVVQNIQVLEHRAA